LVLVRKIGWEAKYQHEQPSSSLQAYDQSKLIILNEKSLQR